MNITVKDIIQNERDNEHISPKVIGLFTHNSNKAENKLREMSEYYEGMIERLYISTDKKDLTLSNGIRIKWIRPTDTQRGNRCHGAIIDRDVCFQFYDEIIFPMFTTDSDSDNVVFF